MYRCLECGGKFEEPDYIEVCYEAEAGVASLFKDYHWGTVAICPDCGDYCIEEYCEEDEDEFEE